MTRVKEGIGFIPEEILDPAEVRVLILNMCKLFREFYFTRIFPQGSAGGPTVVPCRPGFSQNFYTVFIPQEQLQGQSIVKGKSL